MRIAPALFAASLLGCGSPAEPVAVPPPPPTCAGAWQAITASLAALHAHAGKPAPALPDRDGWIATCEGMELSEAALRCLQPEVATHELVACAAALDGVDRTALDQPFLDTMLPKESP